VRGKPRIALPLMTAALLFLTWSALVAATNHGAHRGAATASRAQATCELCGKPISPQSEVTLESAADRSEHHYRCVHCALVGARDWVKGDVTITARSGVAGTKVEWARRGGQWHVTPALAVVLSVPETHGDCGKEHVAFRDQSEFRSYAETHAVARGQTPIAGARVDAIVNAGKPAAPKQAVCPVSGNTVHPNAKTTWTIYSGTAYYFCCDRCKPHFVSNPASYVGPNASKTHAGGHGGCSGTSNSGGCGGHAGGGSCEHSASHPGQTSKPKTRSHASHRA
jgi:YHS domain-containing protein